MGSLNRIIAICFFCLLLGCEEDVTSQISDLASYVENNPVGEEKDVWLEQQSPPFSYEWTKVILIFGFTDDLSACQELVELYKPLDELPYRCTAAN